MAVRVQKAAAFRIDEIYRYTLKAWGKKQADVYITRMFAAFELIATEGVASRPIPAAFEVDGFVFRFEKHFVYWRYLSNGDIGIVTVLHERMHQFDRFRAEAGIPGSGA